MDSTFHEGIPSPRPSGKARRGPLPGSLALGGALRARSSVSNVRRHAAFSLLELVAVMAVVALVAGLVVARVPHAGALGLDRAGRELAERLSTAREQAILLGRPIEVRVADRLPHAVRLDALDVGGAAVPAGVVELAPDGDALPVRIVLADEGGARIAVVVPPGFHRAWVEAP